MRLDDEEFNQYKIRLEPKTIYVEKSNTDTLPYFPYTPPPTVPATPFIPYPGYPLNPPFICMLIDTLNTNTD